MTSIVTCIKCQCEWDEIFSASGQEVQDLQEPPTAECVCPECGYKWLEEFPGWLQYGYA